MKTPQRNGGNVRREPQPEPGLFEPGDVVAITPAAFKMARLSTMSPRLLYDLGWPNEFLVLETFESEEDGKCVMLDPCCGQLVADRKTGKARCNGHPSIYFKKVGSMNAKSGQSEEEEGEDRPRNKGDRTTSASFPWLGEVAAFNYQDDAQNPRLKIKIAGHTSMFTGPLAKGFAEVLKGQNLL